MLHREKLACTEKGISTKRRPSLIRETQGAGQDQAGDQGKRIGNETRKRAGTGQKDSGHQGPQESQRGKGTIREDGREDAQEAGRAEKTKRKAEQVVEQLKGCWLRLMHFDMCHHTIRTSNTLLGPAVMVSRIVSMMKSENEDEKSRFRDGCSEKHLLQVYMRMAAIRNVLLHERASCTGD